jgi:hypothetical protein
MHAATYLADRDAALPRAFVDGKAISVVLPSDVLARRFGAAGASKELAARQAVLAHRLTIERLSGRLPPDGELTIE